MNFSNAEGKSTTIISPGGYLVYANRRESLKNSDGSSLVDIWDATIGMNNTSPGQIILYNVPNCQGNIVDIANQPTGYWFAGDNDTKQTMERIDPNKSGSGSTNWHDNNLITRNGSDAGGNKINGTPKKENSVSKSFTEISGEVNFPTLTYLGNPYIIKDTLTVPSGKTLTIEPGVVVRLSSPRIGMRVDGTLKAIGGDLAKEKIVFTSYKDDEYGGSGNPAPGDWGQIYFGPTSVDSTLINTIIRYGGQYYLTDPPCPQERTALRVEGSSIILKDSVLEQNKNRGLYLINSLSTTTIDNVQFRDHQVGCTGYSGTDEAIALLIEGGSPKIKNSTFERNTIGIYIRNSASQSAYPEIENNIFKENKKPIYVSNSYPSFKNNQAINNNLNGILVSNSSINQNTTWQADLPYIIEYTLTISQGKTLIIEPGVVIKFYSGYSGITVNGTLNAIGTENEKIIFTSYRDEKYGGSGGAKAGDWYQIYFSETSTDSKLNNIIVKYGGGSYFTDPPCPYWTAAIRVKEASILIKNSTFEQNQNKGLYLIDTPSTTIIDSVQFLNHQVGCGSSPAIALLIDGDSPTIKNSTFKNNYYGIYIQSGEPTLEEGLTFGENDEKNNIDIYSPP